ncbi:MAG: hypothetical protein ACRCX0_07595, partial [Plesiomonas sp.]
MDNKIALSVLLATGLLTGCSSSAEKANTVNTANANTQITDTNSEIYDPFVEFNRTMWDFNYTVLDPY